MYTTRLTDRIISIDLAELAKDAGYSNGGYTTYIKYHIDNIYDNDENHPESHKAGEVFLENGLFHKNNNIDFSNENCTLYEAPTQSLLQQWIRVTHDIHIEMIMFEDNTWGYQIILDVTNKFATKFVFDETLYDNAGLNTYEDALEDGLKNILLTIK